MRHYLDGDDWQLVGWYRNQWRFTTSMELGEMLTPAVAPQPASVPGAIQADLLRNGVIPDPRKGLRSREIEWTNNRDWFLEKRFSLPDSLAADGRRLLLVCEGLDPCGEIHVNGEMVCRFDSMMRPVEIDLTGRLSGIDNLLRLVFYQTPEIDGQFGFTDRIPIIRSRFNYIWDWCPRIIPTGAWKSVYIETSGRARIRSLHVTTDPDEIAGRTTPAQSGYRIDCALELDVHQPAAYEARFAVVRDDGCVQSRWSEPVIASAAETTVCCSHRVQGLRRWWPRGMGEQHLFRLNVELLAAGTEDLASVATTQFGVRSVALQVNPGAPANALPYTLVVNGSTVFMKGVNWVPLSPWYGTVTRQQYRSALERFAQMGCNLLRVWGGAMLERPEFFELCDELGLLVWYEFPQSSSGISNFPNSSPEYLAELERVADSYIRTVRNHPSLAVWCGGNELMDDRYRPVDAGHPTIALLSRCVERGSPEVPFLPASPSGPRFVALLDSVGEGVHHDVHGPWKYDSPRGHYELFNADDSLLRTETGAPGHSRQETLERWADGMEIWPPDESNPYWTHRGAWWIDRRPTEALFGAFAPEELPHFLSLQRFLQAEALRYAAEATRRRAPSASGFLVWMGNEPFPNASNTSLIEYDLTPKPAHALLARSFAPVAVTARYDSVSLRPGERLVAEIVATWDGTSAAQTPEHARWRLVGPDGRERAGGSASFASGGQPGARRVGTVDELLQQAGVYVLCTELVGHNAQRMEYYFSVSAAGEPPLAALRTAPEATVRSRVEPGSRPLLRVENPGPYTLLGLFVYGAEPDAQLTVAPNMITLLPGEERELQISAARECEITDELIRLDWINRACSNDSDRLPSP